MSKSLMRSQGLHESPSKPVLAEGLEPRLLLSRALPVARYNLRAFFFNDIDAPATGGAGTSQAQLLVIRNAGKKTLVLKRSGLRFGGADAADFVFLGKKPPVTMKILPGKTRSFHIAFRATTIGIESATLTAKSNDPKRKTVNISLRGLGTAGAGSNLEPSLQRILDLYQIPVNVGEPQPQQTFFPIPPASPNDEVSMQKLTKASAGPVTFQLLGVFDNFKTPATKLGWYSSGNAGATHDLLTVPRMSDAQTVRPYVTGATSFDPGSSEFGIYTVFPAFNSRHAYSEDSLNTWESSSSKRRKVRFWTLKNADGSVVPNSYVFATEDWNQQYDFNDVVGVIRNVRPAGTSNSLPPSGDIDNIPGLVVQNLDALPGNDRLVFNRISHLDKIRPNVVHDVATLRLTNTGGSTLSISSISLLDNANFQIQSGGGSNIALAAGSSRDVKIRFVGSGSGSTLVDVISSQLKITARAGTDAVTLAGLWQAYSEQTPKPHMYSEPSLMRVVNELFGYKTVIANAGQTTVKGDLVELGTHGGRGAVGEETLSAYWQAANASQPVKVRMLAAWHRQNNFDQVTGAPLSAASEFSYYFRGSSSSRTRLFTHNINEGQAVLQHISNSTIAPAQGSFSPGTKTFGFESDKHFSDDTLNALDFNPSTGSMYPNTGHAFRFYALKDENGNRIANTWLAAMDYTANKYANWDYNDNLFIISNVKPAGTAAAAAVAQSAAAPAPAGTGTFASAPIDSSAGDAPLDVLNLTA